MQRGRDCKPSTRIMQRVRDPRRFGPTAALAASPSQRFSQQSRPPLRPLDSGSLTSCNGGRKYSKNIKVKGT